MQALQYTVQRDVFSHNWFTVNPRLDTPRNVSAEDVVVMVQTSPDR